MCVHEHKSIVKAQKKIIEEQNAIANALFRLFDDPIAHSHLLPEDEKNCPCCKGKMHKQNSRTKTYVLALPMLSTETHISESYRCISCNTYTTASNPIEMNSIGLRNKFQMLQNNMWTTLIIMS